MDRVRVRPIRGPRKDGSGRWYWRTELYRDRKTRTVWTGWGTPEEARRAVADLVARDRLDEPEEAETPPARTVKDLLEYWTAAQEERADLRPVNVKGYIIRAGVLTADLGDVLLDRVSLATLEGFRDRRMHAGRASRTVAGELTVLATAWRWGREVGHAPERDLPSVHVLIRDTREKATPTPGEVAAVVKRLDGWRRLAVLLLYGSGCRLGEVASLTWDRVDLEAGEIRV